MVVTVDMIATGTDVKPLEVLLFLRDVRSETYFEQMRGRGVRSIATADLVQVTPDATAGKDRFVLIDAVGVTESRKIATAPLERCRAVGFDKLVDRLAEGDRAATRSPRSPPGLAGSTRSSTRRPGAGSGPRGRRDRATSPRRWPTPSTPTRPRRRPPASTGRS
jgi:hypothetical protein